MEYSIIADGGSVDVKLVGRLDAASAPELSDSLSGALDGATDVVFDLEQLDYLSSAGLRVLLAAHKRMAKQGTMKVINISDDVMEVFEITGFAAILDIS